MMIINMFIEPIFSYTSLRSRDNRHTIQKQRMYIGMVWEKRRLGRVYIHDITGGMVDLTTAITIPAA